MYYSLRITPQAFGCPFPIALGIVKHLLKNKKVEKDMYITADEKLNKYGEPTTRHFHFNFVADYKKDSLGKVIKRWFQSREYKITGNDSFALSDYNEPDDIKRWIRYLMKEKYIPELTNLSDFTADEIKQMEVCAKDERKTTTAANIKHRQKKSERMTLYEKLEEYLNDKKMNLKNSRIIYISILEYYMENNHSVNSKTIDGYVNLYMLKNKMLTPQEFYDINH